MCTILLSCFVCFFVFCLFFAPLSQFINELHLFDFFDFLFRGRAQFVSSDISDLTKVYKATTTTGAFSYALHAAFCKKSSRDM